MKPKPFSALNHFTVPCATCAPTFSYDGRRLFAEEPGLALPPVDHERGTRTARKVQQEGPENRTSTQNRYRIRTLLPWSGEHVPVHEPPRAGKERGQRVLADEAGRPDRLQRRLDAVRRAHHRLQRVEGLEPL